MLSRRHSPLVATQVRHIVNVVNKPTVVVIGTGWAGARLVRDLNPDLCNIQMLSQRNHMIFTPLLPQTCTGTLEFRSICEPITRVQPALAVEPNAFQQTMVYDVDLSTQRVQCISVGVVGSKTETPVSSFEVPYDYLVLAHGARPNTFNIPGVEENAFFLRETSEARAIRRRLVQNIMTAQLPNTTPEERKRLCNVVIVGGGPTGVEFASDLADFVHRDLPKLAPALVDDFQLTVVEAMEVLGTFDRNLRNFGVKRLEKLGVKIVKAVVAEVTQEAVVLKTGEVLRSGLVVWGTGVAPSALTTQINLDKNKQGRLVVDDRLRVQQSGRYLDNVFAMGDCAANSKTPLPTLAAVAARHGLYLAGNINKQLAAPTADMNKMKPFVYKHIGSMCSLGRGTALVEMKPGGFYDYHGFLAFVTWRSAYFTMLGSFRSRLYVLVNWCGSFIWGRDTTYIADISESKSWKSLAAEGASKEHLRRQAIKLARENKSAKKE